ncbi:MAG: hypothetical protein M5U01_35790 [Ardenticatenaceae bacterium]|nr:hypothetical protein [Ardenticatenaceae bacterium]
MSVVQNLLHQRQVEDPDDGDRPISGLVAEAQARGASIEDLAERAEMSVPLVGKLDRRLIRYPSIPLAAIKALAQALDRTITAVARYLQGRPRFALQARYWANQVPTLSTQEDFFDAVRNDTALSEERRQHWLALQSREE